MHEPQPTTRLPQFRKGYRVGLTVPDGNRSWPRLTGTCYSFPTGSSIHAHSRQPPHRRPLRLPRPRGRLPRHARQPLTASKPLFGLRPANRELRRRQTRRPPPATKDFFFSLFPLHTGMRQYWRDMDSLLTWTRSEPHRAWWKTSCATPAAPASGTKPTPCAAAWKPSTTTSPNPIGFARFAPNVDARGSMFTAAHRTAIANTAPPVVNEEDLYGSPPPKTR